MSNDKMQKKYLPFNKDVLMDHFAPVGKNIKARKVKEGQVLRKIIGTDTHFLR